MCSNASSTFVTSDKSSSNSLPIAVLHARLGHTSVSKMQHILVCKHFLPKSFFCDTCMMAQFTRLPFNKSSNKTTFCFQLVHMDVWGPYRIVNLDDAHCFLTLVDEFSRSTWTYLLRSKAQVPSIFIQFYHMVSTHFSKKLASLRSDNGMEFINSSCGQFFADNGILHQKSVVKTPQQSGVVERKHRYLLDTARALGFQAGFPKSFWGECILSATHLVKKLPMENLGWKSPFKILHGSCPSYEELRTISCLCFAKNTTIQDKFDSRARKCVLLGYLFGIKGYKLYNLEHKKFFLQP